MEKENQEISLQYYLSKKGNAFLSDKEQFIHFLSLSSRTHVNEDTIVLDSEEIKYNLLEFAVGQEKYFILTVSVSNESKEENVKLAEKFDGYIASLNDMLKHPLSILTVQDDISKYYSQLLYPRLSNIEILLRQVIYSFILRISGSNWQKNIPPKVNRIHIAKKDEGKNNTEINDVLSFIDFIDLGTFLFQPYSLKKIDQESVASLLELIGDNSSADKVKDFLQDFEEKSNWDRYFKEKIDLDDFDLDWKKLYEYRNCVAHSRRIRKADFENADRIITKLEHAFNSSLEDSETIQLNELENNAIGQLMSRAIYTGEYGRVEQPYFPLYEELYRREGAEIFSKIIQSQGNIASEVKTLSDSPDIQKLKKIDQAIAISSKPIYYGMPVWDCVSPLSAKGKSAPNDKDE